MQPTLAFAACVVLAASAAGCSSGEHDGSVHQLSEAQAQEVLLTAENLGEGYESDPDEDDDGSEEPPLGCLDAIGDFDKDVDGVDAKARFAFEPGTTAGVPEVTNGALSFETVAEATAFMEGFTDTFADCHTVEERAGNGVEVNFDVGLDDDRLVELEIDEQVNLRADGSFSSDGGALKFSVAMSVVRVQNNVVAVLTADMAGLDTVGPLSDEYTRIAVDRLTAVAGGQAAPDDTATVTPSPHTGPAVTV
jgi:hypothetical protein